MSQIKVDSIIPRAGLPSGANGGIIQTVSHTTNNTSDYNSNGSFSIITALDAAITVRASGSSVLIMSSIAGHNTSATGDMAWKVYRNAGSDVEIDVNSSLVGSRSSGIYPNMRGEHPFEGIRWNYNYLDTHGESAGTEITYRFGLITESNSFGLNYARQNNARQTTTQSHVILMEVN